MTPILTTIDPWILTFSAVTVFATIFMGFWSARKSKTASDFFVAGRSVSVGWNASAISGEYLSAASFMGVAGMVMSSGYDALWYPVCYACGYLFLLLFIAGPLRRFGAYTIPDFAEGRFDSPLFRKIAVVFVLFIGFFYTMPQMKGAGTTLAYIFPGLPYWVGVALVGAVITLNVALGGMKGITLVQAFQYWAKMFAISVPIFVLMAVYGDYGKQLGVNGNIEHRTPNTEHRTSHHEEVSTLADSHFSSPQLSNDTPQSNEARIEYDGRVFQQSIAVATVHITESKTTNQGSISFGRTSVPLPASITEFVHEQLTNRNDRATGIVRQPLPEKAPKDETWLNPFGPLTTKAAKAAKPRLHYEGPMVSVRYNSAMVNSIARFIDRVGGSPHFKFDTNQAFVLPQTNYSAFDLTLFATTEGQFKRTLSEIRYSPVLKNMSIVWPHSRSFRWPQYHDELIAVLKTNGVTVIESGSGVEAVPTSEIKITPAETRPYALLYTYSLIIALVCGTAGLPHILVRFYTNPDGVAAKRTTMWVMILIGIFYVFPPVFGVMGRNLMPELYNGLTGVKGTDGIVLKLPTILRERYGALGSILSGVTCAGAFAAFMSTFSGLLVSMTGALAHDVYGRMLRPKSTSEQRLRAFKVCAVLIGGIAIVLGCFVEPLEINFMVGQAFAIAAASYFPLLFMSVWWRGMTMRGAATGMLTGGLCALAAVTLTNFSNLALDKGPMGKIFAGFALLNNFWAAHPLLRILCEQPAIWTVPLAIGLMIFVGKMTSRAVPTDIRMKMLILHAPEKLGLKQEYIQEHQRGH